MFDRLPQGPQGPFQLVCGFSLHGNGCIYDTPRGSYAPYRQRTFNSGLEAVDEYIPPLNEADWINLYEKYKTLRNFKDRISGWGRTISNQSSGLNFYTE